MLDIFRRLFGLPRPDRSHFRIGFSQEDHPIFDMLREGRRRRRIKDFDGAEACFERACKMNGGTLMESEVEIARTWWRRGWPAEAIERCNELLPREDGRQAAILLGSIFRDRAKSALKTGDLRNAMGAFRCIEEIGRKFELRLLTAKDRESMKFISRKL